jgi:L,D-transpeptidase-like protein/putative peptidoglycan binding protein
VVVALAIVVLLGGAGALLAYDSSQSDTIAKGITIGGVDVGGLSSSQAKRRLRADYVARFSHPRVLRFHGRRFVLSPRATHVTLDVDASVQQALARSRADNLFVRAFRSLTGGRIHERIDPQVRFSHAAVARFVSKVSRTLDRPARDASISWAGYSISPVASQRGRAVRTLPLSAAIGASLSSSTRRVIRIPVSETTPKVSTSELAARYPTVITIDRSAFTLRLWRRLRLVKSYTIAVGMAGLETPAGLYHVQDKEVDPSWHVPNSSWAGSLAGQTIPPGPADPIKARWMGIYNGAGIHGTDELGSLGSAASHGCIRMAIPDVIQLYGETPLGTPVYIA